MIIKRNLIPVYCDIPQICWLPSNGTRACSIVLELYALVNLVLLNIVHEFN